MPSADHILSGPLGSHELSADLRPHPRAIQCPVRSILFYALFFALPMGFGEYYGLTRQGHAGAWWIIPVYLVLALPFGWFLRLNESRKPSKLSDELNT